MKKITLPLLLLSFASLINAQELPDETDTLIAIVEEYIEKTNSPGKLLRDSNTGQVVYLEFKLNEKSFKNGNKTIMMDPIFSTKYKYIFYCIVSAKYKNDASFLFENEEFKIHKDLQADNNTFFFEYQPHKKGLVTKISFTFKMAKNGYALIFPVTIDSYSYSK